MPSPVSPLSLLGSSGRSTELRRARERAEDANGESFERYLDRFCAMPPIAELASIRYPADNVLPGSPAGLVVPAERRSLETPTPR